MSESFGRLPDPVKAKAREKTLLVLAKANSRATVHRPAYLDYVGVKTFGADGEVTGERRFLGLFSSAAYTESLLRIPLVREKVQTVLRDSGFDPQSHAGKALLDTLETYPRDDLFHTPVEELGPLAEAAMQARERRAVRMFIRKDTYGRYVSVLVYLPARPLQHRRAREVRRRSSRSASAPTASSSTCASTSRRPRGSTSSCTSRRAQSIPDVDTADLERRLADASRSWRDDFTTAVIAEYGEEVGAVARPPLPRLVPRGLQGGLRAAHGVGRPRSARGHRRRRGHRPLALPGPRRRAPARRGSRSTGSARPCR